MKNISSVTSSQQNSGISSESKHNCIEKFIKNLSFGIDFDWSLDIHNQSLQQFSHTCYVMCVYFKYDWRDLQVKGDSESQVFVKLSMNLRIFAKNLLRVDRPINIFIFSF